MMNESAIQKLLDGWEAKAEAQEKLAQSIDPKVMIIAKNNLLIARMVANELIKVLKA